MVRRCHRRSAFSGRTDGPLAAVSEDPMMPNPAAWSEQRLSEAPAAQAVQIS